MTGSARSPIEGVGQRGVHDVPKRALWKSAIIRLGGSAVLLTVLFVLLPLDEMWAAFTNISPGMWVTAIAVYLSLHLLGVAKWRMMINVGGAGVSFAQAIRFYYAGLFGNTFLPSIIGGDVVRAGLALKHVRSKAGLLFGSVVDRTLDIFGLALVAGIGVLLLPAAFDAQSRRILWGVGLAFALIGAAVLAVIAATPVRRFPLRVRRKLVRLRQATRAMRERPATVLLALLGGMALQTSLILLTAWLGRACGIDQPLRVWLFVWPLAKISAILPVTQGGLGVREAAQAALFAPFGVPAVLAVAVSLVFQAVIISGGLVGGSISFLIGRASGARRARDHAAVVASSPRQPADRLPMESTSAPRA